MENFILKQLRLFITYGEAQSEFLASQSEMPPSREGYPRYEYVFAKKFTDPAALREFTEAAKPLFDISREEGESLCELMGGYDEEYFLENDLIILFNDERSGSNVLDLKGIEEREDEVILTISRKRGLTMDMAYILLLAQIGKGLLPEDLPIRGMIIPEYSLF